MTNELPRAIYARLPFPLGLVWVRQALSEQTATVYKAAESVVRWMFAAVLSDILDAQWTPALMLAMAGTGDRRGLTKLTFGARVELLRLAVEVHNGCEDRVLPSLREWWPTANRCIAALVHERNQDVHGSAVSDEPAWPARERLAEFLRGARWLRQVQQVYVSRGEPRGRRMVGAVHCLVGQAPFHDVERQAEWPTSCPFSVRELYLASADGRRWTYTSFLAVRDGQLRVFDGVTPNGDVVLVNPTPAETGSDACDRRPMRSPDHAAISWTVFLDQRARLAKDWRFQHDGKVHAGLQLAPDRDAAFVEGGRVDRYELLQPLGWGGSATVWEVRDTTTDQHYALKILRDARHEDEAIDAQRRFDREAQTLLRCYHRGCRRLLGPVETVRFRQGEHERSAIRMPLMRKSLSHSAAELRDRGTPPTIAQVIRWGAQALESLTDLHLCDVVHRDVKPSNFLVDEAGEIWLSDLGSAHAGSDHDLTATRETLGTERYKAPEQTKCARLATGRSDVYSLAMTLHELLKGEDFVVPGKGIEGEFGMLLGRMGDRDPELRPDAAEALREIRAIGVAAGVSVASVEALHEFGVLVRARAGAAELLAFAEHHGLTMVECAEATPTAVAGVTPPGVVRPDGWARLQARLREYWALAPDARTSDALAALRTTATHLDWTAEDWQALCLAVRDETALFCQQKPQTVEVYTLRLVENDTTIRVPINKAGSKGGQELIAPAEVPNIYEIIGEASREPEDTTGNRRYRAYMEKLKTGKVQELARVLRALYRLKTNKDLSYGERKLLDQSLCRLVKELARSVNRDENDVERELEALFSAPEFQDAKGLARAGELQLADACAPAVERPAAEDQVAEDQARTTEGRVAEEQGRNAAPSVPRRR